MKVIFSHPTGNANVRAAAYSLAEANILAEFYTTIAAFPGSVLDRLGGISLLSEIRRRRYNSVLRPFTRTYPWVEMGRLLTSRAGFSSLSTHEAGVFCIDAVYRNLDQRISLNLKQKARRQISALYGYEDGALRSFQEMKRLGGKCFYDLPTGYWRAGRLLLQAEQERWPEWLPTLTGFHDSESKLARKDEELHLADCIIVASQFTAKTLEHYPGTLAPIKVIPYGFPAVGETRIFQKCAGRKLKLLYVGRLSQQKGVANLFAAVDKFKSHVELTLVGHKASDECPALDAAVRKHRWIPTLPHEDILQLMREHDVLVFPSLFDGFGLVITEAMSQGTPVVATERCAGPDFINDGQNGWLIEAGVTESLEAAIERLLLQPGLIAAAGHEAVETARSRPWKVYGYELANTVKQHLLQYN